MLTYSFSFILNINIHTWCVVIHWCLKYDFDIELDGSKADDVEQLQTKFEIFNQAYVIKS